VRVEESHQAIIYARYLHEILYSPDIASLQKLYNYRGGTAASIANTTNTIFTMFLLQYLQYHDNCTKSPCTHMNTGGRRGGGSKMVLKAQ
jgi:hypothetical protein